jgi:hypothetical protein
MMPAPLRSFMVVLWVFCVAGAAVIVALAMGWLTWVSFAVSGAIGLVVGVPGGLWTARRIKRSDARTRAEGQSAA